MTTLDDTAELVHRLSVLLQGGVSPASAWAYLGGRAADAVATGAHEGRPIAELLDEHARTLIGDERESWRALAASWAVAADTGAPLASTLARLAHTLRALAQVRRDARVALAAPVATARLVMVLPLLSMVFGAALGFDTLGVLVGTPVGWGLLGAGLLLLAAGSRWNRSLVRRASRSRSLPGVACDLAAIAVSGGMPADRARDRVLAELRERGIDEPTTAVDDVLDLSRRAGVPAVALLRAEADAERRRYSTELQARVARLGVTLMIPLGVCVLPAFLLLGVAPMLVSVVSSTAAGF